MFPEEDKTKLSKLKTFLLNEDIKISVNEYGIAVIHLNGNNYLVDDGVSAYSILHLIDDITLREEKDKADKKLAANLKLYQDNKEQIKRFELKTLEHLKSKYPNS